PNYRDVFDVVTVDEFRTRNRERSTELGEQKQVRLIGFETDIVSRVSAQASLGNARVLHPSLMYRAFNPYWWGHKGEAWVRAHARFNTLPSPDVGTRVASLPANYVAVKFYYNDAFPATAEN